MECEYCHKFFHNRHQLGPHTRVCPQRYREEDSSEGDEQALDVQDSYLSSAFVDDPKNLLRSLATRPVGVWGVQKTAIATARPQIQYDDRFTVDYTTVSALAYSPPKNLATSPGWDLIAYL